jgi:hypothetical protein
MAKPGWEQQVEEIRDEIANKLLHTEKDLKAYAMHVEDAMRRAIAVREQHADELHEAELKHERELEGRGR